MSLRHVIAPGSRTGASGISVGARMDYAGCATLGEGGGTGLRNGLTSGLTRFAWVAAACAVMATAGADDAWARKKKPPVVVAPPPPPIIIPQRPYPPDYAPAGLVMPAVGADGLFASPNRNITPAQTLWNLRAAYNVAALNCAEPNRTEITASYRAFLRAHARTLSAANRDVDAEFRARYGAAFVGPREQYMTFVYNGFAFPPTLPAFCNAALAVSRDAKQVKSANLRGFAANALPAVEVVFDSFRRRYAQYQADLAAWDQQYLALYVSRYGPPPGMTSATLAPAPPATAPAGGPGIASGTK